MFWRRVAELTTSPAAHLLVLPALGFGMRFISGDMVGVCTLLEQWVGATDSA